MSESGSRVTIRIPTQLSLATGGVPAVETRGNTVKDVFEDLIRRHPELGNRILSGEVDSEEWELRRYINIYLNGDEIRFLNGFETAVAEGDVINILPASAGG